MLETGSRASALRRVRLLLGVGLLGLLAWLVGPLRPGLLPGAPTLVPHPGQSHIHTILVATWWAAARLVISGQRAVNRA